MKSEIRNKLQGYISDSGFIPRLMPVAEANLTGEEFPIVILTYDQELPSKHNQDQPRINANTAPEAELSFKIRILVKDIDSLESTLQVIEQKINRDQLLQNDGIAFATLEAGDTPLFSATLGVTQRYPVDKHDEAPAEGEIKIDLDLLDLRDDR